MFAVMAAGAVLAEDAARPKPNVLFLFTDDQQHDTVAALGNPLIKTPSLDKLVANGVAFTNAYIMGGSSPAVCSPSRACLMTGRTLWNIECQGMWGFEISEKFKTLPEVFREAGYVTFATGKNEPGRPGHFARAYSAGDMILFRGMTNSQFRLPLFSFSPTGDYSNGKQVTHAGTHSAEVYANAFIEFLQNRSKEAEPFFAYVAFQTPHDPRQFPEEYGKLYPKEEMPLPASFKPEHPFDNGMLKIRDEKLAPFPRTEEIVKRHLSEYYATITHTDAQIGRILEVLERSGESENTIVVLASDNGLAVGQHGLMGKQNVYDHSVHVPFIISGPGIPRGEKRDQLCYIYDVFPTLCERASLKVPETVQYKSLNAVIEESSSKHRDHLYFAFMSWQRAVYDGHYKLIEYCVDNVRHTQLFDLKEDPQETVNLAGQEEHKPRLEKMRALLKSERLLLNDGNSASEFADQLGKDFWNCYEAVKETSPP